MLKQFSTAVAILAIAAGSTFAGYVDITSYDGNIGQVPNGILEDQELESGSASDQVYDLEAFIYDYGTQKLGMVGGYNFNHVNTGWGDINGGDIFIDYEQDNSWDYAIDLDFNGNIYTVYQVNEDNLVPTPWGRPFADPFEYNPGDDAVVLASGNFVYEENLSNEQVGFLGDELDEDGNSITNTHYRVTGLDLSTVLGDEAFFAHYTMTCGNDFMVASVPEPAMLSLLGIGFMTIASCVGRKKR